MRIDKYLWVVRIFKTRSKATQACDLEKVKIGGQLVKASRQVKAGDVITIRSGPFERVWQVVATVNSRQPAKNVAQFCTETTPEETIGKMRAHAAARAVWRQPGLGRPTKKERRELDEFMDWEDW